MNRRDSIAALAVLGAFAAPFGVGAQQPRRVVLLAPFRASLQMGSGDPLVDSFMAGLRDEGLVEGRDYTFRDGGPDSVRCPPT
jgi:hypothetical protein